MSNPSGILLRHSAGRAAIGLLVALASGHQAGGQTAAPKGAEAAVRAASQAYQAALARGDATAVAALWTADGDIVDDLGSVTRGRDAASGLTPPREGEQRPAFAIDDVTVRILTESVAIEDGVVEVTLPGATAPHHGRFSATWVKQADGWKVASLREWRTDPPESAARLADLDWLVGKWNVAINSAESTGGPAPKTEMSIHWNDTQTYLLRETRIVPADGGPVMEVSQRIGWDPLARQIRSWAFSSDGAHADAQWALVEGSWVARTTTVHADGSRTSSINRYLYDGKDQCTVQSFPTHAWQENQAPVTMTMTRKSGETIK